MATHIITDPYSKGQAGEAGQQLKNQIAGGLQNYAEHKMRQISQRNQAHAYQQLGLPADISHGLSILPPEQQKQILGTIGENQGFPGQAGAQQMGMGQGPQQQSPAPQFRNKEERALYYENLKEAQKENRAFIKETQDAYKDTKENDLRLSRLKELSKSGKLTGQYQSNFLDALKHGIGGFGIDLTGLFLSPESEEFNKVSNEMIKGARSIFGNRITDTDLRLFMQMIPNSKQSPEGRLRVIHQMELMSQAQRVKKQAMDQILRANGGQPPSDLREQVDEVAGPMLDRIAQQYKAGISPAELTS